MRLIVDMNLSPRWVRFLVDAGFDAEHWSKIGSPGASDGDIMDYARLNECVVLTHDLDFSAILATSHRDKPSVVQIRSEDVNPESVGHSLIDSLRQMAIELGEGALLTIEPGRSRLRLLPLARE